MMQMIPKIKSKNNSGGGIKVSLSLVLPCYNVTKYLPKCLDSIFENDCSDIEIVLVNDGSSDDIGGG